jgi:hypothetical protein
MTIKIENKPDFTFFKLRKAKGGTRTLKQAN